MPRTTRRATFRYHFTHGYTDLCPDCSAVLQREGEVAGDPREEAVTLAGLVRAVPAPLGQPCCTCEGLEAYEDALNASRVIAVHKTGGPYALTAGGIVNLGCHDTAFGTPAEHARWHELHGTPTPTPTAHTYCDGCAHCNGRNIPCQQCPACTPTLAELEGEDSAASY